MNYDTFIKQVQTFAQLDSRETAEKACQATLETLRDRILGDEASHLAAQLPGDLARYLEGREGQMGDHFKLEEFYDRMSQKAGVDRSTAAIYAKAVFSVLNMAVSPGEFEDVIVNLSEDYEELFAASIQS
jgi:uncharacterized protein (DUF2267 family)